MAKLLSIIVLTYNSRRHLKPLLESIAKQTYQPIELIVVDNASSDDTVAYLREQKVRPVDQLIVNSTNEWFAAGNNRGIRQAKGDYLYICNDDIVLTKQYCQTLVEVLEDKPECAMVGGKLLKLSFGIMTSQIDSAGLVRLRSGQVINRGENLADRGQYNKAEEIFGITGAGMLLRRSALEKIKYHDEYFDEDFVAYKEDIDLSWRLRRAGFTIWYEPQAVGYHARSMRRLSLSHRKNTSAVIRGYSYRNHWWTLFKNLSLVEAVRQSPWLLPYEFSKFVYLVFAEWSTLRYCPQILRGLPRMLAKRKFYAGN